MPEPPQDRTEPLRTLTLIALSSVTETPSSDPATPTRSNPLRSSVTPLAAISTPCLAVTPVTLAEVIVTVRRPQARASARVLVLKSPS